MYFIVKVVFALLVIIVGLAFFQTWRVEHSENQAIFARNSAPNPPLDGFYNGSVNLPVKVTWTGKTFTAKDATGINVFDNGTQQYPFTTSVGTIGSTTVLDIKYDFPQNPFWIRPITDQLVETGPGHYLGKMTLKVIPGLTFSLGFFRLQR